MSEEIQIVDRVRFFDKRHATMRDGFLFIVWQADGVLEEKVAIEPKKVYAIEKRSRGGGVKLWDARTDPWPPPAFDEPAIENVDLVRPSQNTIQRWQREAGL